MTADPLSDALRRMAPRPLLLDAGMGSALLERGLPAGTPSERWNLERPELVRAIHASHVAAGSDVLLANTFGGSAPRLAAARLAHLVREVNEAGVRLARAAASGIPHDPRRRVLVAGSAGPTGLLPERSGAVPDSEIRAAYEAQCTALAAAGADFVALETMTSLREATQALRAARAAGLPACVSFTLRARAGRFETLAGEPLGAAARAMEAEGARAVGANCSAGSKELREALPELLAAVSIPVWIKPNAGLPEQVDGRSHYRQPVEAFVADLLAMATAGARLLGGCCGTDARHLEALRRALDAGA